MGHGQVLAENVPQTILRNTAELAIQGFFQLRKPYPTVVGTVKSYDVGAHFKSALRVQTPLKTSSNVVITLGNLWTSSLIYGPLLDY